MAIRPESAAVYRGLATFRRALRQDSEIPAELLREMLEASLEVCERLNSVADHLQDLIELWMLKRR